MVSPIVVLEMDATQPPVAHVVDTTQAFDAGFVQQGLNAERGVGRLPMARLNHRSPAR